MGRVRRRTHGLAIARDRVCRSTSTPSGLVHTGSGSQNRRGAAAGSGARRAGSTFQFVSVPARRVLPSERVVAMFNYPLLLLIAGVLATTIVILALPEMDDRLAIMSAVVGVLTSLAVIARSLLV